MRVLHYLLILPALFFLGIFIGGMIKPKAFENKKDPDSSPSRKFLGITFGGLFVIVMILIGVTTPDNDKTDQQAATAQTTSIQTITEKEAVPFTTTTENDPSLEVGQNKVKQPGVNGSKEVTYKVTYTDGEETKRENISEIVTAQPKPQITLTGTKPKFASGGVGLTRADWESQHGPGQKEEGLPFFDYENGILIVQFSCVSENDCVSGNVKSIERKWGDRNAVSLDEARAESKNYIPSDAAFIKTYISSKSGSMVDLYSSESLKNRFAAEAFIGGNPGDFIILYRNQTGRTTSFITAIGNNP